MSELYLGDQLITPVVMETVIGEGVSNYNDLDNKPTINDVELVGNKTLDELGIQAKGDYALASDIPDLTDYVKNTDYASTSGEAGLIRTSSAYGTQMVASGYIRAGVDTLEPYNTRGVNFFIGKGTLENIKDDYVKRGLTENTIELTDDEKTSARTWLGAIGDTDYATGSKAGIIKASSYYGCGISTSGGYLLCATVSLDGYQRADTASFISKGTLVNVLAQYKKVSDPMTEEAYNALETKDANTLYLIEE